MAVEAQLVGGPHDGTLLGVSEDTPPWVIETTIQISVRGGLLDIRHQSYARRVCVCGDEKCVNPPLRYDYQGERKIA